MAAMGAAAGHPELALFYGLLLSWVFLFVTGIPIALSVMAYSKDLQLLRVLPVRPAQIVAAKGFLLYLYALPMSTLMLLPAVVVSARPLGAGAAFWLAAAVHLLVSPLLPVALSVFVVLALMRLVDLSRFRTAFEVAGMALGLGLVIGLQTFLQRSMLSTMGGGQFSSVTQFPDLFAVLARALPPLAWAARSFVAGVGPVPMAASLGLTVACAAAAFAVAPLGFLRDSAERARWPLATAPGRRGRRGRGRRDARSGRFGRAEPARPRGVDPLVELDVHLRGGRRGAHPSAACSGSTRSSCRARFPARRSASSPRFPGAAPRCSGCSC